MRDIRFVAEHRGGLLTKDNHKQLILWACKCVENVLPLIANNVDERLINALKTAKEWAEDKTTVGNARNAPIAAIRVANELINPIEISVARAVGHAVATAHMADHSLRATDYALKAMKLAGKSIDNELKFQDNNLPLEISELVLSARTKQTSRKTIK